MKSNASKHELNAIFSNVNDITELTMQVITLLEDTIEMKEEENEPAVGSCFEGKADNASKRINFKLNITKPA